MPKTSLTKTQDQTGAALGWFHLLSIAAGSVMVIAVAAQLIASPFLG